MPDVSLADLPAQVALALSLASSSTGTDYNYLLTTARTESSFQTEARAPTSSAQGLFQFIEETWIRTVKDEGGRYGLNKYAGWIAKTADGRYVVDTPEHRAAILKLRNNPKVSAMMAAAYAKQNTEFVQNAIGRRPTSDELYLAHFLGPADAVRLIQYRDSQPSFSAPDLFPAAAKANRPIFYGETGPRSIGQVYDLLVSRQHGGANGAVAGDGGPFFSSGIDFGTWSPKVQKIYEIKAASKSQQLASADGLSLFDFFAGKAALPATKALVAEAQTSTGGWDAQVDAATTREAPYVTVADDYPSSLLGGGETTSEAVTTVRDSTPIRIAEATPAAEEPRLKIIHVPQN